MTLALPARSLGSSPVAVSRVCLGTAPLGNLFTAVDQAEALATVRAAWLVGVRTFDTAPHYGLGLAERRLGTALRGLPREELTVCTKVGRLLEPIAERQVYPAVGDDQGFAVVPTHRRRFDFTAAGVRRSLEESCERLGTGVDIALLHDPDDHLAAAAATAYPALAALRDAGVIKAVGAGMNSAAALTRLVLECRLDVVLLAGRYSLLDQSALDALLPAAHERGTAVLVGGVFNSGLLAAPWPQPGATFDYAPASAQMLTRARAIATVCAEHGATLPEAAVQFPLAHPAVAAVVVGARSAAEITEDVAAAIRPLPPELWEALRRRRLVRDDAPVPGE